MAIDEARLKELIRQQHETGRCSEELGAMILGIAKRASARLIRSLEDEGDSIDREELLSRSAFMMFCRLPRIDPEGNPFIYLWRTVRLAAARIFRDHKTLYKHHERKARGLSKQDWKVSVRRAEPPRKGKVTIGDTFGSWTVLEVATTADPYSCLCQCVCGIKKPVTRANLQSNKSKSCGCRKHDWTIIPTEQCSTTS